MPYREAARVFGLWQAQGAGSGPLSEIYVSGEGEAQAVGDEVTDFSRGTRGMLWILDAETLPVAITDDVLAFRELFPEADMLFRKSFRAEGFSEDVFYRVLMGDTEIGGGAGRKGAAPKKGRGRGRYCGSCSAAPAWVPKSREEKKEKPLPSGR